MVFFLSSLLLNLTDENLFFLFFIIFVYGLYIPIFLWVNFVGWLNDFLFHFRAIARELVWLICIPLHSSFKYILKWDDETTGRSDTLDDGYKKKHKIKFQTENNRVTNLLTENDDDDDDHSDCDSTLKNVQPQ